MLNRLGLKLKEQKGFTLIELLAVIVILGIIAAIAIPAIGNVISKSQEKATVQEGLLIIDAAKMFVANNPDTITRTLAKTDLADYLDRVEDATFNVNVTLATGGKYTYTLSDHPSVGLVDQTTVPLEASETELLNFDN
jgi:type IV pilus assembly protein PilA